jgi:bacterioferritin-associated ferredoxin
MYVCLCNAITDRDLRRHTAGEDCSVAMVYRSLGCEVQCCKCVPFARQLLRQPAAVAADQVGGGDD